MVGFKRKFLDFMIESGALLFGEFTLKSGRKSPYFMNAGEMFKDGGTTAQLGNFYGNLITESKQTDNIDFNVLFGPAYKGIPLATITAASAFYMGQNLKVCYDRKERKTHGEGSKSQTSILGYTPQEGDKIAIVEDVTTAGTSIRDTFSLFESEGNKAEFVALYIAVDRMEKGTENISATDEIRQKYGMKVYSIVTVLDIIEYLKDDNCKIPNAKTYADKISEYLKEHGV